MTQLKKVENLIHTARITTTPEFINGKETKYSITVQKGNCSRWRLYYCRYKRLRDIR